MPDPGEMPRTLESIGYFQESLMTARQYMVTIDASDKNVAKTGNITKRQTLTVQEKMLPVCLVCREMFSQWPYILVE